METEFRLCKECKHVKKHVSHGYYCDHPNTIPKVPDLVTGEYTSNLDYDHNAWRLRGDESKCGRSGKWWESRGSSESL